MEIGVFLHSYALPMEASLDRAIEAGFDHVQMWNIKGDHDPKQLTPATLQALQDKLNKNVITVSSLCGHLPLCDPKTSWYTLPKLCEVIDLAAAMDVPYITTETGMLPEGVSFDEAWQTLLQSLDAACSHAALRGRTLAIEAGSKTLVNSPDLLERLMQEVDSPALRINLDPANLYKAGHDPVQAVYQLSEYIVHAHAKDAKLVDGAFIEPRLGDGDVPLKEFFAALKSVGFAGVVAIEREAGTTREADIMHAWELLKGWL